VTWSPDLVVRPRGGISRLGAARAALPGVRAELQADAELLGTGRAAGTELVGARIGEARELVARVLGAPTDEIVLQPSTTHGLAHAMFGLEGPSSCPPGLPGGTDHRAPRRRRARARGARDRPAGGIVTPDAIADALETTSPRSR
jgi:hypothetical protein